MPTILLNGFGGGAPGISSACGALVKTEDPSIAGPTGTYNCEFSIEQVFELMWRIRDGNVIAPLGLATSRFARSADSFPFIEISDIKETFCSGSLMECAPPDQSICAQYEEEFDNETVILVIGGFNYQGIIYQYDGKYYPSIGVEFLHALVDLNSPFPWPTNYLTYGYFLSSYREGSETRQVQITNSTLPPITLYAHGDIFTNPYQTPAVVKGSPQIGSIEILRYFTWDGAWDENTGQRAS